LRNKALGQRVVEKFGAEAHGGGVKRARESPRVRAIRLMLQAP
jgi:hypothetical protein